MIAIIDYDAGNIKSVEKALLSMGETPVLTRDPEVILQADHIILPGVGSFGDAMENLNKFGLIDVIHEAINRKIPFLGICLGLQLLFESSEETPGVAGLGILKGKIVRIPEGPGLKIPHMGWNSLNVREGASLFKGLEKEPYVYFVHSYYLQAKDPKIVAATTEYGVTIHASVEKENVFACQFHPEKSSKTGLAILKNFLAQRREG
ncbi:imidazole glycerol phosphate synthase subunit HisH [Anthropogastromicrobium sp.]|uniref:imidazole glycerol phosphate synthase subunit HisH n=1 Tax=Anthropogastromicrobium sp. TaxID=2981649 RepID=UPI0030795D9D